MTDYAKVRAARNSIPPRVNDDTADVDEGVIYILIRAPHRQNKLLRRRLLS
jgi:hypothetical protein